MKPTLEQIQAAKSAFKGFDTQHWGETFQLHFDQIDAINDALELAEKVAKGEVVVLENKFSGHSQVVWDDIGQKIIPIDKYILGEQPPQEASDERD